jgi:hypothetical protein
MTITLNGTTGITTPADTITGNATVGGTLTVTGATTFPGAGLWATDGSVGIGATPTTRLQVSASTSPEITVKSLSTTTWKSRISFGNTTAGTKWEIGADIGDVGNNNLYFYDVPSGTERMRIDSSGNLLVGTTSSTAKLTVNGYVAFTGQSYAYYAQLAGAATTGYVASGSGNWSIWCSDRVSATEFNARSDARLKKDVTNIPISDAVNFVKNVPAVHYKWKNSSEDGHKFGFLAQDVVKAGFPNLVGQYPNDELKLETDVDGFTSPAGIMLTVNYDQIIPLLSTAIKELSAKNDALEARLAAVEAK